MDRKDNRGIFAVLVSAFDELDLLLQKMFDYCARESKGSAYSSYEYPVQSAFKALRGAYNVLITYARDVLVGEETGDKLKIIERRHQRLVYQRGRFENFLKLCRLTDYDDITLFDFGDGISVKASVDSGKVNILK